jgi:hypothetical protein
MDDQLVRWFLVFFYRHEGRTEVREFQDQGEAFKTYIYEERRPDTHGPDPELEIVLIGSDSLESVRAAYPHYFSTGSRDERLKSFLDSPMFA